MNSAIVEEIYKKIPSEKRFAIAIDGRCASGKTTLAGALQERLGGTVFHIDDYFLRPEQRTAERLAKPGENVDHERFEQEVLLPLKNGAEEITYRPFDCGTQTLKSPTTTPISRVVIVEGSYSCHAALWDYYDLRVFLTVNPETQIARIKARNPDSAAMFQSRWIPLEEKYFAACEIKNRCDLCFENP